MFSTVTVAHIVSQYMLLKRRSLLYTLHVKQAALVERCLNCQSSRAGLNVTPGEFISEEVVTNHLLNYTSVIDIYR